MQSAIERHHVTHDLGLSGLVYSLRVQGTVGDKTRELLVAIGAGAQGKHQLMAADAEGRQVFWRWTIRSVRSGPVHDTGGRRRSGTARHHLLGCVFMESISSQRNPNHSPE
jgi:hypothetical protein